MLGYERRYIHSSLIFFAQDTTPARGSLTPTPNPNPELYSPCHPSTRFSFAPKRHMFRDEPDRDERVGRCDRQALPLAEALLERGWQHGLSAEHHVFALMPLRHTPRYNARPECCGELGGGVP